MQPESESESESVRHGSAPALMRCGRGSKSNTKQLTPNRAQRTSSCAGVHCTTRCTRHMLHHVLHATPRAAPAVERTGGATTRVWLVPTFPAQHGQDSAYSGQVAGGGGQITTGGCGGGGGGSCAPAGCALCAPASAHTRRAFQSHAYPHAALLVRACVRVDETVPAGPCSCPCLLVLVLAALAPFAPLCVPWRTPSDAR
jgi:hypothetical protein